MPVLPTTPFVLVAAACFTTSSPALYKRLLNSPSFGEFIRNYREKTGISKKTRIIALTFLWSACNLSNCRVAVSAHLLTIKGVKEG